MGKVHSPLSISSGRVILFFEQFDHVIADFIHIADDAVVAVVEDGCVGILVDRDEELRIDAGHVVHR